VSQQQHSSPTKDEFVLDTSALRQFITAVEKIRRTADSPEAAIAAIRPHFAQLMADQTWLPEQYRETCANSGMGNGIGTWLLYRAGDGGLAFSSLVVPPGVQTPVHDHLAWGLVGLYRGEQAEDVFARRDDGTRDGEADLVLTESRALHQGDFYPLLPDCDIHRVRTTSNVTSVSLHLLGNDNGCIWRHRFLPEEGRVEPFKSGYVNVECHAGPGN
jgi:predicted metal-dependent enzyme (double-stranded beta helix superfamily)